MLDLSAGNLSMEVNDAVKFRKLHTEKSAEIVKAMIGSQFRTDMQIGPTPDNLIFGYNAFMLPELCYSNPGARLRSSRPQEYSALSDFLEMSLDSWLSRSRFGNEHIQVVTDMLSGYGVMMIGMEPVEQPMKGGYEGGRLIPYGCRIAPDRFIMDGRCDHWCKARFLGHEYERDIDWIKKNARNESYKRETIEKVEQSEENYAMDPHYAAAERAVDAAHTPPRKQIRLCDIWCRDTNEIITLVMHGRNADPLILRQEPYYGPDSGPYEVFGAYQVPDDPYPISRMQAAFESHKELNAHVTAFALAAKTYKKIVVVDGKERELNDAFQNSDNGDVCAVRNFNPQAAQQYELGGGNEQQAAYIESCRQRWDENSGTGGAQRGAASAKTATAEQITQSNIDGATAWVKEQVYRATANCLKRVCWYNIHDPNIVEEVSRTDPISGKIYEGLFVGGIQPGQEDVDWSTFMVEIVPESMSRQDSQVVQARAIQLIQLTPQLYQMKMSMLGVNVDWLVNMLGESINQKNLATLLFNPEMMQQAKMMAMQQAQQQQMNPPPGPGGPANGPPQAVTPAGSLMANPGLGPRNLTNATPQPKSPVFPTTRFGVARPVSKSNGPGMSPLPKAGLPRTQSVGRM